MAGARTKAESSGKAQAEAMAIAALTYLAGEPEEIGRFLNATGLGPDNLRAAAAEHAFLAAVLDHVTAYEPLLASCAAALKVDPAALDRARRALSPPSEEAFS
jgi:hypothetical protein